MHVKDCEAYNGHQGNYMDYAYTTWKWDLVPKWDLPVTTKVE